MKKWLFLLVLCIGFLLRFYLLGQNPPSLYWDEASLGYNAYAIATSLKDEHGEFLPVARFAAFGDYKPPGYIYATVPGIKLFGLNEFSVRFPSAVAGILMVILSYFLVKEWFEKEKIALMAAFFLAISPWSIHFSRAAFEAHLAALFNLAAVYFFILSQRKKWALFPSVIFFIFSFYTFNANRIIAPLLLIALSVIHLKFISLNLKWTIASIVVGTILIVPSIGFLTSSESRVRLQEVSIWNNLVPLQESNREIANDQNAWWARIIHNRRVVYGLDYLRHYFDNFTGRFLFTHGDVNPRLNPQEMGHLYVLDLPLILLGVYFIIAKKEKAGLSLLAWMIIIPIPAGLAKETPHALRIISILPTYQIISAFGLFEFIRRIRNHKNFNRNILVLLSVTCFLFSVSLYYFLHNYFIHFPIRWSGEWQNGYKQMVENVLQNQNEYDAVFVTKALGRPYIYFAFYGQYPLEKYLVDKQETKDQFGFYDVKKLGKIYFDTGRLEDIPGKILYVGSRRDTPNGFQIIKTVKNLSGDDVFVISQRI